MTVQALLEVAGAHFFLELNQRFRLRRVGGLVGLVVSNRQPGRGREEEEPRLEHVISGASLSRNGFHSASISRVAPGARRPLPGAGGRLRARKTRAPATTTSATAARTIGPARRGLPTAGATYGAGVGAVVCPPTGSGVAFSRRTKRGT